MKEYRWTVHFGNVFVVVFARCRNDALILACAHRIAEGKHLECNRIARWDGAIRTDEWNGKFSIGIIE
jgi:hypothetical protein